MLNALLVDGFILYGFREIALVERQGDGERRIAAGIELHARKNRAREFRRLLELGNLLSENLERRGLAGQFENARVAGEFRLRIEYLRERILLEERENVTGEEMASQNALQVDDLGVNVDELLLVLLTDGTRELR